MRPLIFSMALLAMHDCCCAQSLTIVDSEAKYSYRFTVAEDIYDPFIRQDSDSDEEHVDDTVGPTFEADSGGILHFGKSVIADVEADGTQEVLVSAFSAQARVVIGDLFVSVEEDSQSASAKATVQAVSANSIDDVEVIVTFNSGGGNGTPGAVVRYWPSAFFFKNRAGDEYFNGIASGGNVWYPDYPVWSSGVPIIETEPEIGLGVYASFNLFVESGSEIEIEAQCGHSNMVYGYDIDAPAVGIENYAVSATTRIELAP